MKAIVYTKYGSPNVLQATEIDKPTLKDNEVLIKVYAASINSWDWDMLRGKPHIYRLLFGIFKPKLNVLGCDIAGKVESVGCNVTRFKPGDEVFGDICDRFGGFAEYVCVQENTLFFKPVNLTFVEAAAIPQAAILALQSFYDKKQLKKGDKVLINGAGGGVGTFGLQIAKYLGAEVTCVDKMEKLEKLKSLGADYVIDYKSEDFTDSRLRYDVIIDVVANRSIFKYRKLLLPEGVFVMIGGTIPVILQAAFLGPLISMTGSRKLGILVHKPNKYLEKMNELFETGIVNPVIDKIFTLRDTAKAFHYFGENRFVGKIVISMGE